MSNHGSFGGLPMRECCWGSCHSRAPQQLNPSDFSSDSVFANWLLAAIPKIEEQYRDECPAMNGA